MMPELEGTVSNRWLTALTLDNGVTPEEAVACLAEQNIEARPLWKPARLRDRFSHLPSFILTANMSVSLRTFSAGASVCRPGLTCLLRSKEVSLTHLRDCLKRKGENMDSRHVMSRLKETLTGLLSVIPPQSDIIYADYPLYGNVGDLLIMKGTEAFLKRTASA